MSCPVCGRTTQATLDEREREHATVRRPGRAALLRTPAPVWARAGAAAIDEVTLAVPLIPVVLVGLHGSRTPGGLAALVSTVALVFWIVGALLYGVIGAGEGQTLGKRALGIVVVDRWTGVPIGYERALARCVVLLLMLLPCLLGLVSVVSARTESRRGWHDRAAGSVVVRGSLP